MGTVADKSDDEYSVITDKGDIGFVDFDISKSACSYNPYEESEIVVISVPFPLIEGKPKSGIVGEPVVDSITIVNTTNESVELWSIKIYDSKPEDSFTLSLMKPPTACSDVQYVEEFVEDFSIEDKWLRPRKPLTIWLSCKPKEIGMHTSAVHFNVGDETIERVVFVLAEDKVSQSLSSSRPYHRNRKKKAPVVVDASAANRFVVGSRPTRAPDRPFRYRLPTYPIPQELREMIENKQVPDFIGEGLRRDNYIDYFRTLLAIEEIKMEEDMRDYTMESVTMKSRGYQFLSLVVPGLAERRPSLVYGDHIFARLCTADASETTPYQDPYWNRLLWYCADNGSYKGCFLPERLEIIEEDSGQANNYYDDGAQENNWDCGAQSKSWDCQGEGAQENNWDCGAQAKNWDDQGAQGNDWDNDEGGQVKNLNCEGTCNDEGKQDLQPSLEVQWGVRQTEYIPEPVVDEAEWSDGWK